ncbi:NCS2 family permease [Kitasatospora aureofaciens]|uniref:MFS transporter n=1 Tax=Kitasatospora aureofaciens TaxID=1894 RepID=A0A1E7ND70_KITAU|nr:NCS2 family permease [Kitasatospora aureofaciens]QEU98882.1 NCS2 family permease [Streptomyces viridifaciens]ARF77689.1 MFS transporter [Kitasatospora aureofaciens]OEV38656.1 MFS transporter [Kitasatospora aureofaciens]UKZ04891.1 NCS2 family permease [Streptomyces viridifaciens]GGU74724.1 MFS transporter [Kitasatospora aureofaciens]
MTRIPTEPGTTEADRPTGDETHPSPPAPGPKGALDAYFKISARGSTLANELRGGVTTFMAMAYIILLNPLILSGADVTGVKLDHAALTTATALAAAVTTILMGLVGNVPLALAAGLSVSGAVSALVVPHTSWSQAMGLCVIYGLLIVLLVVSGLREKIMNGIPLPLKHAITIGIGLFVTVIGLYKAGFVHTGGPTPLSLGPFGELSGWPVLIFCLTLLTIFVLMARGVRGAILIGIAGGTVVAMAVDKLAHVPAKAWANSVPVWPGSPVAAPDFSLFGHVDLFGAFGGRGMGAISASVAVFTLVLAGFFDAMATIIGVGTEAGLADRQGRMPGLSKALFVDGAGGAIGGLAGASGQTVFVESATGVGDGARTGLASTVTGALFALMLFFSPLAGIVPVEVASAALVVIGSMMMSQARHIDWSDREVAIPAFLTSVLMPFTYSITAGVAAGVISYSVIKAGQGKWREPGLLMWILTGVFVLYFALSPIKSWLGVH